jgi:hypothetical protein
MMTKLRTLMGEAALCGTAKLPRMSRRICTARAKPLLNDGQRRD